MTKEQVLKSLLFQIERAQGAYSLYKAEPVYLHASNIRKANAAQIKLLSEYGGLFEGDLRRAFLELLGHLDVWMEQFHHLRDKLHPGAKTEFIFERFPGTQPFPHQVKTLIEKELEKTEE